MIKLNVNKQIIAITHMDPVVTDSQGYLTAEIKFSDDWAPLLITTFWATKTAPDTKYQVEYEDGPIRVPDEVLTDKNGFILTIVGSSGTPEDANILLTTPVVEFPALKSGLPIIDPLNPTESIWGKGLAEAKADIKAETEKVKTEVNTAGDDNILKIKDAADDIIAGLEGALDPYVTETVLDAKLLEKADKTTLNDYVLTTSLEAALEGKADVAALADYAKASDLTEYAKTADIDLKLEPLATKEELDLKADDSKFSDYSTTAEIQNMIETAFAGIKNAEEGVY